MPHQICFHMLKHKIYVAIVVGLHHVEQRDDVLMALHLLKEHDLRIRGVSARNEMARG